MFSKMQGITIRTFGRAAHPKENKEPESETELATISRHSAGDLSNGDSGPMTDRRCIMFPTLLAIYARGFVMLIAAALVA